MKNEREHFAECFAARIFQPTVKSESKPFNLLTLSVISISRDFSSLESREEFFDVTFGDFFQR
jgi:hypothetical protein